MTSARQSTQAPPAGRSGRRRFGIGIPGAPDFAVLWPAAAISFLGNGVYTTALPLMAAELSSSPTMVSVVVFAGRLPWLLFSLPAGVLSDTFDRKRVMWLTSLLRALLTGLLAVFVMTGTGGLGLLIAMSFLVACADVLFDSGSFAVVPKLVNRDPVGVRLANTRLTSAQIVTMNFVGPPAGGLLFGLSRALPFAADALSFAASAALLRRMRGDYQVPSSIAPRGGILAGIREGLGWVWRHPVLRWLTVVSGVFSLMSLAQMAILVLFARDVLGLGPVGYGLLLTVGAGGSLAGTMLARHVERIMGTSSTLAFGLVAGGCAALLMGFAHGMVPALTAMVLGGGASMLWNVTQISLRQSCTPDRLIGRVNGVHKLVTWGAMPLGAILGGIIATASGLHAPFLVAGVVIVLAGAAARALITPARIALANDGADADDGRMT
ncbi:MAG TPA: MFS transporter [Actinoplanes sp.]|nr:MFS transporter [Actinoplanes sp.]